VPRAIGQDHGSKRKLAQLTGSDRQQPPLLFSSIEPAADAALLSGGNQLRPGEPLTIGCFRGARRQGIDVG
jgi:hypothetical protein